MALDLAKTAAQLHRVSDRLLEQRMSKLRALSEAEAILRTADAAEIERRRAAGQATWLVAGIGGDGLAGALPEPRRPAAYAVAAVDGSHIDVDRHAPVRCFLINVGSCILCYGEGATAQLRSEPTLFSEEADLVLRDPDGTRELPMEGPLLGILRSMMELEALADLVEQAPPDVPLLALLDGTLVLWGLAGQAFPDYVRRALLEARFLPAMERLREVSRTRTLAVAAHVSLPRATEVVNALRISQGACRHETVNCDRHCGRLPRGQRNCDLVDGITDAELFAATLAPGERSPLYRSTSSIMDAYGEHGVRFCYVHLGAEIARLELPAWVSAEALEFAHAALLSQAEKGHGYPVALQEAHELAVVSGADREHFNQLVQETLAAGRLPESTSQKARSKRTRWV